MEKGLATVRRAWPAARAASGSLRAGAKADIEAVARDTVYDSVVKARERQARMAEEEMTRAKEGRGGEGNRARRPARGLFVAMSAKCPGAITAAGRVEEEDSSSRRRH